MEEDDTFNVDSGDARYVAIDSSLRFLHVYPQKGFLQILPDFFHVFMQLQWLKFQQKDAKMLKGPEKEIKLINFGEYREEKKG